MTAPSTYPKKRRLLRRAEYLAHGRSSERLVGRLLILDFKKNDTDAPRLGITASKKYGNAVVRNRFKRSVREAFRHLQHKLGGVDVVAKPRSLARQAATHAIGQELEALLQKALSQPT